MLNYISSIGVENFTLAMLGIVIHALTIVLTRSNKEPFSLKLYFSDFRNYVRVIIAILSTVTILLLQPELSQYSGVGKDEAVAHTLAFIAGFLNHYIVKVIISKFKKKINQ